MHNIAVIDDEAIARKYIISLLGENFIDNAHIIEAKNGRDALEKFKSFVPEIMLVDLRMPEMDGLTLVKCVQETINPDVQAIIVSCYDDFCYSREAMHLNACDYILKPIKKNELLAAIERASNELERRTNEKNARSRLALMVEEKLLADYLDNKISHTEIEPLLLGCDGKAYMYQTMVIRILHSTYQKTGDDYIRDRIKSVFQNKALNTFTFYVVRKSRYLYVVLMKFTNQPWIGMLIKQIIHSFAESGLELSIGVGSAKDDYQGLAVSYSEALKSSMESMVAGANKGFLYDDIKEYQYSSPEKTFIDCENQILDMVRIGNYAYRPHLMNLFKADSYKTFYEWHNCLYVFLTALQRLYYENNISRDLIEEYKYNIYSYSTIAQIMEWVDNNIQFFISTITDRITNSSMEGLNLAIEYIKNNYVEDISLEYASSVAHMNPTYFCEVFKKHTNRTFLEYLTELRIEKAKKLLTSTTLKIYEIAQQTGYNSPNYFTNIFKKYTGMEPKKYRKQHACNANL